MLIVTNSRHQLKRDQVVGIRLLVGDGHLEREALGLGQDVLQGHVGQDEAFDLADSVVLGLEDADRRTLVRELPHVLLVDAEHSELQNES